MKRDIRELMIFGKVDSYGTFTIQFTAELLQDVAGKTYRIHGIKIPEHVKPWLTGKMTNVPAETIELSYDPNDANACIVRLEIVENGDI